MTSCCRWALSAGRTTSESVCEVEAPTQLPNEKTVRGKKVFGAASRLVLARGTAAAESIIVVPPIYRYIWRRRVVVR